MGGIGSGKTTVARIFGELGATVLEADAICAELHKTPAVKKAIRARWGDAVFGTNREIDRARLAEIVFDNPHEIEELNRIMHPKVIERIEQEIVQHCSRTPAIRNPQSAIRNCIVIDAPLLIESGLISLCDVTAFVQCPVKVRSQRTRQGRHWGTDEIRRREKCQTPLAHKRRAADFVIVNSGDLADTMKSVAQVLANFRWIGD